MGNKAVIQRTAFIDLHDNSRTLGVRVYDEYAQTYDNTFDELPSDDMELLRLILDSANDATKAILAHCVESEEGLEIDAKWYEWEELRPILDRPAGNNEQTEG